LIESLGSSVAGLVFTAAGQWVSIAASWLLELVGGALTRTTNVGLGTTWFQQHQAVMAALAAVVVLPMLFAGAIQAVAQQSTAMLTNSFLVKLPLALLVSGLAVEVVRLALSVTDQLCSVVGSEGSYGATHVLVPIGTVVSALGAQPGVPSFVLFVIGLVAVFAALLLWIELVVRSAAIAAAVLFVPLALAGLVWPAVSSSWRRLAHVIGALVLSKFVIVAILSLGAGALGGSLSTRGGGVPAALTGLALVILAAFSPFTLLKMVPLVDAGAIAPLEGARQRVSQNVGSPVNAGMLGVSRAKEWYGRAHGAAGRQVVATGDAVAGHGSLAGDPADLANGAGPKAPYSSSGVRASEMEVERALERLRGDGAGVGSDGH
jgi:hypothetical protein